ncbi:YciI-like protein [Sphingomonas kyeonggiensis]|uniref:YCII-related domain-containing protein n=1 Tax=Sphingomonas kyeonggiensis TaxID=1268553 RepID=A0A7W6JUX9_9SPHN|nr:YciI-like protein [Sphingomonas kyeonggiensis]MBB4100020.1 hypothetical protein [Sphingomonas kyeonggiensis]
MHWLLRYTTTPDYLERRAAFREAHLALAWAAADSGDLILGGAVGDPPESALLLFANAAAARAFAEADPYVANGLVARWEVLPWNTVVGAQAANPIRP